MANNHSTPTSNFVRTIRKFFVSAFVVCSFVAYALHERFVSPDQTISASAPTQVLASPQVPPTAAQLALASPQPLPSPTALPAEAPPGPPDRLRTPGGSLDLPVGAYSDCSGRAEVPREGAAYRAARRGSACDRGAGAAHGGPPTPADAHDK